MMASQGLPNKLVALDDCGENPSVTMDASTFPSFFWQDKAFNRNTGVQKEGNCSLKRMPTIYSKVDGGYFIKKQR